MARDAECETGFTLMEMLVVLVVIGLIAAVAVPQVMKMLGSAKHRAAGIQIETVSHSLDTYQLDVGSYPTTEQGIGALWSQPTAAEGWNGPYVKREKQLSDPWGRRLIYTSPASAGDYELQSLGADGKPGGSGDDADLSSAR